METKKSQLEGLPKKAQGNEKGLGKEVQKMRKYEAVCSSDVLDALNNNVCGYCENCDAPYCDAPCLKNEKTIKNCSKARLKNENQK